MVVVGLTQGIPALTVGSRGPFPDFLAAAEVYRTGRPARTERGDHENPFGPAGDVVQKMNLRSNVAVPIVVEGNLWGVVTVLDPDKHLPPDAEERLEKFTELLATAIANAESRAELAASDARARGLAREQAALRRVATLVASEHTPDDLFATLAEEVGVLFEVDGSAIVRYEADSSATVVAGWSDGAITIPLGEQFPLEGENLAGEVHRAGRPSARKATRLRKG